MNGTRTYLCTNRNGNKKLGVGACALYGSKSFPGNKVELAVTEIPPNGCPSCPNPDCKQELKLYEGSQVSPGEGGSVPRRRITLIAAVAVVLLIAAVALFLIFRPSPGKGHNGHKKDPRELVEKFFKPIDSQIPH